QFVVHGAAGLIGGRDLIFHTDGKLYVANGAGNSIVRFNGQTGLEAEVFVAVGSGGLSNPHGMTFGPDDNGDGAADLYVASQANASVILYDGVTGDLIRVLVQPGSGSLLAAASVLFLDEPCPSDLDDSGDVGVKDLLFLLGTWGPCPKKGDCPADFDNSGDVGVKDLLFLLGAWGPCP
ncbi:MAG: hypothetical protein IIA33_03400, partial [Planctomycetes bacterium]|nr:hypothetical protein [Planctomycetota bacterium]